MPITIMCAPLREIEMEDLSAQSSESSGQSMPKTPPTPLVLSPASPQDRSTFLQTPVEVSFSSPNEISASGQLMDRSYTGSWPTQTICRPYRAVQRHAKNFGLSSTTIPIQLSGETCSWTDTMSLEQLEHWWSQEKWIGKGKYRIESLSFGYSGNGMKRNMISW